MAKSFDIGEVQQLWILSARLVAAIESSTTAFARCTSMRVALLRVRDGGASLEVK